MNFNHCFVPLKLAEAQAFVAEHHRHSKPLKRHRFSIGVKDGIGIRGMATVDNCSSSWANRHDHMEIRRVCTDGTKNLASFLLGKASMACFCMGAKVVFTYTKPYEACSSLLADNWQIGGVSHRKGHMPLIRWMKEAPWELKKDGHVRNLKTGEAIPLDEYRKSETQRMLKIIRAWQKKNQEAA
jgi:hypothetical protein